MRCAADEKRTAAMGAKRALELVAADPQPKITHSHASWPIIPGRDPSVKGGKAGWQLTDAKHSRARLTRRTQSRRTVEARCAVPILLRDPAVNELARETRRLGLAISDYRCWRLLERIDAGGPDPLDHKRHNSTDVQALALTAITLAPRPDWVCSLTGLKP